MPNPPIKKIVVWMLTIFALYAILTTPAQAADMTGSVWSFVSQGIKNIFVFFDRVLG